MNPLIQQKVHQIFQFVLIVIVFQVIELKYCCFINFKIVNKTSFSGTGMIFQFLLGLALIIFALVGWFVYQFVIKLYIIANRLKKMDPTLKIYVSPFTGLNGVQKQCVEQYGDSHWFIKDMLKQNPDQMAYLTNIGNRPFLILCDPKLIKELCLNHKQFKKFNIFKHSDLTYTKGIFFVPNEDWAKQRSIISHSFSHDSLKKMIPIMERCLADYIKLINSKLQTKTQKKYVFEVLAESQLIIGDALVRTFFSEQAAKKTVLGKSLTLALADVTSSMFQQSRTGINVLTNLIFGQKARRISFLKKDKQLQQMMYAIRTECEAIVDDRIAKFSSELEEDFLNHYIKEMKSVEDQIQQAEKEGKPHKLRRITKEEIIHQLVTFYFAGIDTTGHLIAMGFYAIAEYPQCYQKIVQQIKRVIPDPKQLTYEKLQQLQYMSKFLDECLRMWAPAVGVLARLTRSQMKLGPYTLPADFNVGTNLLGLGYNPRFYQNPQKFDPERWNDKSMLTAEPYSFVPFSAGPRSCIGKYLALMESKVMLVHFLYNFDIKRTDVPLRMHAKFLYEPVDENLIYLVPGGINAAKN